MVRFNNCDALGHANTLAGVNKEMEVTLDNMTERDQPKWAHFGRKRTLKTTEKVIDIMNTERFRQASSGNAPMTRS